MQGRSPLRELTGDLHAERAREPAELRHRRPKGDIVGVGELDRDQEGAHRTFGSLEHGGGSIRNQPGTGRRPLDYRRPAAALEGPASGPRSFIVVWVVVCVVVCAPV